MHIFHLSTEARLHFASIQVPMRVLVASPDQAKPGLRARENLAAAAVVNVAVLSSLDARVCVCVVMCRPVTRTFHLQSST